MIDNKFTGNLEMKGTSLRVGKLVALITNCRKRTISNMIRRVFIRKDK